MQPVRTLASLDEGKPRIVEIGDVKVLLVRDGNLVHAFGATCPHAGAPLAEGAVCEGRIICPWHKASFRLHDGALLEPPALDPLTRYPVRVEDGVVLVSPEPIAAPAPPRADDPRTMLIVGAGAAGIAAACALREFGFSGRIVLLGQEPGDAYDRTALSKFVLQGAMPPDETPPLRQPDFYATHRIERLHGEAHALDRAARRLTLADGTSLDYDRILIATGGVPRRLQVPGGDLAGVHTLRSREDARAILATMHATPGQVVIAGASFIGLEAASALREQDVAVIVVSPDETPFAAQFGRRIGAMFRGLHEAHGVRFVGGRRVARIEGTGQVTGVVLDDGSRIDTTLVLVGFGITPATGFATGLDTTDDGGIVVDAGMRAAGDVFAAGDLARFPFDGHANVRVEHWRVAQQQARIAAAGMLGRAAGLHPMPFFWTYHYGKRYEYLGLPQVPGQAPLDDVQVDGDLDAGEFLARLMRDGRVVGIVACGREAETASISAQPNLFAASRHDPTA
jgi:NADPH-dependent 2,4-dienoyl-CoA reductase/sulfur reductase-like enzyme/nitrite reductase/ring-hydroxylating ferredoxin subunit